jgi:hypothetical protein
MMTSRSTHPLRFTHLMCLARQFAMVSMLVAGLAATAAAQSTGAEQPDASAGKLDATLRAAADATADADVARPVIVRLADDAPGNKAQLLESLGFPLVAERDHRTIVMRLTPREAMVLAEDGQLASFTAVPAAEE